MSKDTIDLTSEELQEEDDRGAQMKELETPVLLLAMPQVTSQPFQKSVVLLLRHDAEEGSLGFIVNRPTDLKVADILKDLEIPWNGDEDLPAYLGGPVNKERGTLLYTDDELLEGDETDLPGIAVSQSLGQLQELAEKPPGPFRLYLGYAGWGDGQLEQEILRNDWLIAPFDPSFLFSEDPDEVWYRAIRSVGIDPAQLPAWTPPAGAAVAN
ncbi:MAG: YqgE/AlgH family protein [Thermoanaerobaculia bacterium]|nr:YqgE/AlgH family protein [Thermoanaerobaculia bacterium]